MSARSKKSGQSMVEYIIVFTALLVVFAVLCVFVRAATASAERTAAFVTCEYP
ncbi:MAG: hypothetical protein II649_09445 [Kiritimatiellae bacterium]|nr:hypothetical protein [Kiritimatiellia bacterium]